MRPFFYLLAFVLLAGIFEGAFADREQKVIEEAHKRASEQHARIYGLFSKVMSERVVIYDGETPVANCYPRRK